MTDELSVARAHYEAGIHDPQALLARIEEALNRAGLDTDVYQLERFDQFHLGGLAATEALAEQLRPSARHHVLDAGSGLGGPSRAMAQLFGCKVTGVDLVPAYVDIARLLAAKAVLEQDVHYLVGSVTRLPLPDASFDGCYTQHVLMNVRDRRPAYAEIRRVLKSGAPFVFYDPYLPDAGAPPHYPTPWAESAATSFLLTQTDTRSLLEQAGLRVTRWEDVTAKAQDWMRQQMRPPGAGAPAEGVPHLGWVLGPRMPALVANYGKNLQEGRVRLVIGVCEAV